MLQQLSKNLSQFLVKTDEIIRWDEGIPICKISHFTSTIQANSYYFGHPEWGKNYLESCHRDAEFINRWQAVLGDLRGKVVVDIGCGPGNVYASLRDRCGVPDLLIGVDVSLGALKLAQQIGYSPLLADAQQLPLASAFADIVMLNATLHHCDDMAKALTEAARLVRPGGILVIDHDPQRSAWGNSLLAKLIWNLRLPVYRLLRRGGHATAEEQTWSTSTEAHHKVGDGVTPELFDQILSPLGFRVNLYPHNRRLGAEVFKGKRGQAEWHFRLAQRLCGINPDTPEGSLLLMCVATR